MFGLGLGLKANFFGLGLGLKTCGLGLGLELETYASLQLCDFYLTVVCKFSVEDNIMPIMLIIPRNDMN